MKSSKLPSVLQAPNPANSLSMERALKQIQSLLTDYSHFLDDRGMVISADSVNASIDDLETMLKAIDRSDD